MARRLALASILIVTAAFCAMAETGINKTSNANSDQKRLVINLKGIVTTPRIVRQQLKPTNKEHDLCRRFGAWMVRRFQKVIDADKCRQRQSRHREPAWRWPSFVKLTAWRVFRY